MTGIHRLLLTFAERYSMPDVLCIHLAKFGVDSAYTSVGTPYPQMPMGVIGPGQLDSG